MSKEKKHAQTGVVGLVPELRFPEFKNDGEWVEKHLGDVFETFSGGTPKSTERMFYGGSIPFIRSAEIAKSSTELYLTDEGLINSSAKLVKKGDLLIALYGANSGDVAISKIDGAINQAILCLQSDFSNEFIGHYFFLKKDWVVKRYIQGGQGNLSGLIVKSIKLFFPKKDEQQKIASCLSSLDELIAAHNEKLEALKDHKKGLIQNLFPQEGETIPKLRFPEFENDGEWDQRNLGEVGEFIGGGTPSTSNPEFWDGDILWYTPTEVKNGILNASMRTITRTGLKNSSAKLLPIGAILITTRATIGDAAIALNQCATNQGFQSLVVKKSENNQFWYYWIIYHKNELERRSSGSTFKEIGKNEIKIIPTLSPSIQEQQKIATSLSSLDELITAQQEKIEQLQEHKIGLMQGLFPKLVN